MSLIQRAMDFITQNPHKSTKEVSEETGIYIRTVARARERLNEVGEEKQPEKIKKDNPDTTFTQKGNEAEYSFKTSSQIKTLDDLIKVCDIDLTEWKIDRWICNKWEVGAKNAEKNIVVTPLFQIKVWLKAKVSEEQSGLIDLIKEIFENHQSGTLKVIKQTKLNEKKAIKATISDMHVGLDPNVNGKAIFNYEYNEKIFNANLDKVFNSIIKEFKTHGKFDLLLLDDLGDGLDGWNGETTRSGHKLDQNMDNVQQFKVYVEGKLRLIENIIEAGVANKIKIRNVSNCNHAGNFGYIANMAIQMMLNRSYDKKSVDFYILEKFIEHFEYGSHTFILTHGKDSKYMFKGLPLDLNDKAISFINDYIDHYHIISKYIHLEKGDLHQVAYKRTKKFDYRNFMSFAPPSAWVQNNFGDTYSGYSIQVIPMHNNEISHTDYFFDLKTSY